jgi:hypothetical protein
VRGEEPVVPERGRAFGTEVRPSATRLGELGFAEWAERGPELGGEQFGSSPAAK